MYIFHQETKEKEKYTEIIRESVEYNLTIHVEAEFNKQINSQDIQKKMKNITKKYLNIAVNLLKITSSKFIKNYIY